MSLLRYICLWLIPYTFCFATGSIIQGHITDSESGEPLIGANIILLETSIGSASDISGAYIISDIPIGEYTLRAMFIGYESLEKEIWVEGSQEYTIDIMLKSGAIELQETKVTAEKRKEKVTNAPASMEIVTSRDIKGKNTTNMGAYLKGLKGIDFTSSGINNYSISVRGFNSSFSTRLLTLSDGRVANIPALRVINYSTIPQSMDDVDKIEVLLGPATALYGANAHSGVVNIISKPPSQSEGLTMSLSGSNDDRQLRKINGRFAKKLSNALSIKISGLYLHAYDWPFISEAEYKAHLYPWSLSPGRTNDGKDNNPWNGNNDESLLIYELNNWGSDGIDNDGNGIIDDEENKSVRIGNGEAMDTGDPDGDGVMGEDWFNGYDDDGDGLIDEDYFIADGIDNNAGCNCPGDGEIDEEIDMVHDFGYDGVDNDNNGIIDDEAGSGVIDGNIKEWGNNIENNILINRGRYKEFLINGDPNPYYIEEKNFQEDNIINLYHLLGTHRFNADKITLEFDIFNYDFGEDGLPGDPFFDKSGDGIYQRGEYISGSSWFDHGIDGIDGTGDYGEGDGIWQPADGWIDSNGNGIIDQISCMGDLNIYGGCSSFLGSPDTWSGEFTVDDFNDLYPLPNGIWEDDEEIIDCGNDGYCWDDNWTIGEAHEAQTIYGKLDTLLNGDQIWFYGPDLGENDGILAYDSGENNGIFDTGDNIYGFPGEQFEDNNDNNRWDTGELFTDTNGDGLYTPPDLIDNYQPILDKDGDGISDYPDNEIDNRKVEIRIDFDPSPDLNMTLQSGYSWTKTQQVTGTGRYLADGFEYKFYQLRSRYKNWFAQYYMNESFSGKTRGYNLGNRIIDKSKNYAYQIQNNFNTPSLHTKIVWGVDYFKTDPKTFGTILNDGPNGYDNDGDNVYATSDSVDNDLDGVIDDLICPDGQGEGFRLGKYWACGEGIDEPDEFIDPVSNEYGLYYQSTTELFGTSRYEFITAARLDYHDLLDEGALFAPKVGLIYKPDSKSSLRFTYGKAHNTPNSITLFTDLFIGSSGLFNI